MNTSVDKTFNLVAKVTPNSFKKKLDDKIIFAGRPFNFGVNHWMTIKGLFLITNMLATYRILLLLKLSYTMIVFTLVISTIIAFMLPDLFLNNKIQARKKLMNRDLPEVIDLLAVSVQAGLSFDGALARVVEKMEGELVKEFNILLREIRMGKAKKESLRRMALKCNLEDLTTFLASVSQADELGVSITNVLKIQSQQIKEKRKQKIQEEAMKAPIKILFPLILFIFPSIFVILLGPAVIRIIETLL